MSGPKDTRPASRITVTVSMNVKPEALGGLIDSIPGLLTGMLARPGALTSRALQNPADPTKLLFIDEFESEQAVEDYFAWRSDRGDVERLGKMLTVPATVEIWPVDVSAVG